MRRSVVPFSRYASCMTEFRTTELDGRNLGGAELAS
jgi:hypothetical protein